ncbi:MAG: metallophosphoesterase [Hormoscilla sp. GM102CHS1]|nr:metallophosphoesterase [Hormoscilla sp. GM102CHS1]
MLSLETLTVEINGLPAALSGTKLVQMSDFHYDGDRLPTKLLARAIGLANEAEPDLVLLTGDFVTYEPDPIHELVKHLKHLQSRAGIYTVLGNHDMYYPETKPEVMAALNKIGIKVLWNEVAYPLGYELALVGMPDFWSREFNPALVMDKLATELPRIVLSHQPDSAQVMRKWRVDLQLSGHTHGGQIWLPKIGPLPAWLDPLRRIIPKPLHPFVPYLKRRCHRVVKHWEWAQGFHQVGENYLYVNRGLGTYWPGRLFCPPEVTVITLVQRH